MPAIRNSNPAPSFNSPPWLAGAIIALLASVIAAGAVRYCANRGYILYYGDAEAHLNIARRVLDSRTPGFDQLGTVWLPLPHALMLPLIKRDAWWRSGVAGAIPSAAAFVLAVTCLFAMARRALGGTAEGTAAAGIVLTNPNAVYLAATPMTEMLMLASITMMGWVLVRYRERPAWWWLIVAAAALVGGTLTRYEAWFLIPFAAVCVAWFSPRTRALRALAFTAVASLGPIAWMLYNRWFFGDPFEFYRGPYSARAIQGPISYPGYHDLFRALEYYGAAIYVCVGLPLAVFTVAGAVVAVVRRRWWPLALFSLPGMFYVWSLYSAGTPIFVPMLWPFSYYNTRYALALLPFCAYAAACLVALAPRWRAGSAALVLIAAAAWNWRAEPVTWQEAQRNSVARREWTRQAAQYMEAHYRGGGIFTSFGDMTGILREAGIPLREGLTGDNNPHWAAAVARPDLFLWEEWAIVTGGDMVQTAINRSRRRGPNYVLVKTIIVKDAPVFEIYHRSRSPNSQP